MQTPDAFDPRPAIAARVAATSIQAVSRDLGIPREQIARLAGGFPVRPGTLALARERLARQERPPAP
jgi:hypothetical protein